MDFDFDNIVKVLKAFNLVYQNRNNEANLISALMGNGPDTASILISIEQDVMSGFKDVVNAIQEQTLLTEWSGIATSLSYAHATIKQYQAELATVSNASGSCMITSNGQQISLNDWCLGTSNNPGVLDTLAALVNDSPITAITPSVSSLAGIFSTSTPAGSSSSLGINALSTWMQIVTNAQSNQSQSLLSNNYKYETQYESVLRLMTYTHTLVAMVYYIHDSALQLLTTVTGSSNNYVSVLDTIVANFGDYNTAGTVWNQFAQEFQQLSASAVPEEQIQYCAYTSFPSTPNTTYSHLGIDIPVWAGGDSPNGGGETYPYYWGFCSYPVSLANNANYPNSFFGSLGYIHVNQGSGSYERILGVQGTVVTAGAGLKLTTQGLYPDSNFYSNANNWNNEQFSEIGTFEDSWVAAPQHASPNHISVITGFQLQVISNGAGAYNIGLALQFGVLDVTNPDAPVVTVNDPSFISPVYTSANGYQDYTSMCQSGRYDATTGDLLPAILSNATLSRVQNGDNSILVQVASSIYEADFLQPDKLSPTMVSAPAGSGSNS